MFFQNAFINWVKKSLVSREIKREMRALKEVRALLLRALNFPTRFWVLASFFSCLKRLTKRVMQGLCCIYNPRAIIKDGDLNKIFSNGLADSLGMKLLEV